jgi:hypothetical protein
MKAEQRYRLNKLARTLVTPERFGWLDFEDTPWARPQCPYDNPNCPNPVAPVGMGYHIDCTPERRTEVER